MKRPAVNRLFPVDTGAKVSAILRDPNNLTVAQAQTLRATNGTGIHRHGHRSPTFDQGLNRKFPWLLTIVDIPFLFIMDLLVDTRHWKIVESQTSLIVAYSYAFVDEITPQYAGLSAQQPYSEPLGDYPGILRHTRPLPAVTTKLTHHLVIMGPPTFSLSGRLAPDKYHIWNWVPSDLPVVLGAFLFTWRIRSVATGGPVGTTERLTGSSFLLGS